MPNGKGKSHACGRSCFGLFRRREIGVSIYVREADAGASVAGADEAAEHDAAIAAKDHKESVFACRRADRTAERTAVLVDRHFVARPTWRTLEVLVGGRDHVAAVARPEPLYEANRSKRRRRLVDMLRLARPMVGAEPDARGSPNDADVLSRFWFSSRSHSGSLSFHLRVGQQAKDDREHPIHLAGATANCPLGRPRRLPCRHGCGC
jgi:hypothetical protein